MKNRSWVLVIAGLFSFACTVCGQKVASAPRPAAAAAARPAAAAQTPATVLPPEKQGQWQGGVFTSTVAPSQNYNPIFPAPTSTTSDSASAGPSPMTTPSSSATRPAQGSQSTPASGTSWASTLNSFSSALALWGAAGAGNSQTRPGGYNIAVSGSTPSGYNPGSAAAPAAGTPSDTAWLSNPQQKWSQDFGGALNGGSAGAGGTNTTDDGRYRVDLGESQTATGQPAVSSRPVGFLGQDESLWPAPPASETGSFGPNEHEPCGVGEFCDPQTGHPIDHANENMSGEELLEKLGEENVEMDTATLQPPLQFFADDILGVEDYIVNPEDLHTAFGWLGDAWPSAFAGLDFGWGGLGGYFEEYDPDFSFGFGGFGFGGFGFDSLGSDGFDFSGGW